MIENFPEASNMPTIVCFNQIKVFRIYGKDLEAFHAYPIIFGRNSFKIYGDYTQVDLTHINNEKLPNCLPSVVHKQAHFCIFLCSAFI